MNLVEQTSFNNPYSDAISSAEELPFFCPVERSDEPSHSDKPSRSVEVAIATLLDLSAQTVEASSIYNAVVEEAIIPGIMAIVWNPEQFSAIEEFQLPNDASYPVGEDYAM